MYSSAQVFLATLVAVSFTAPAQTGNGIDDSHKLVQLEGIQVSGTRLPSESVVRISGLKVGQMINDDVLKQASDKLTSTGLVKGLDYGYNVKQGTTGVYLTLKVFDEGPLLPVRVFPSEDAQFIWGCLQSADPIFMQEMPNTEKAIHFYSINMSRCLADSGAGARRVAATVACDGTGKSIGIDFHVSAGPPR